MDNSISINTGENNSMNFPSFIWTAKFNNCDDICQFDFINGTENRFKLVQDNINNLKYFILWNKNKCFTVDLINGLIYFNKELLEKIESNEIKYNLRLIFFRRHQVTIGTSDLKEKNHLIHYHLGYQYLDKNLNNHKIILIIDENGNWILGE